MTTTDPYSGFSTTQTHQRVQAPDRPEQVRNNAGGFVFEIDPLTQLRRFLTIGTAGGTFYVGASSLTDENGRMILELTKSIKDHRILVDEIVAISVAGRAPKPNPALFALAIACQHGETESKQYARQQITKVVRTGTHLFTFMGYLKQFGGFGMGMRKALEKWYTEKEDGKLPYQLVKYRQREGWEHADVLKVVHPRTKDLPPSDRAAINWALNGDAGDEGELPWIIEGFEKAKVEGADIPALLRKYKLPWEALPDSAMNNPKVWDVMLDNGVPLGALLRQLPRLTKMGVLPQMGGRTDEVISMLLNAEQLEQARIHPINVLLALKTYAQGHSINGDNVWTPTTKIIDGLDEMFYAAFGFVQPTGKRFLQACDISYSMTGGRASDKFPLSPAEITGAMALTTARIEPQHHIVGFSSISGTNNRDWRDSKLTNLNISGRQRLDDVMSTMYNNTFGGTDASLPMRAARENGWEIDTFVVYTDNETWDGQIHPYQELTKYRQSSGIDARLIVVAVTATKFSLADPRDKGMLDIAGFDSAVPQLISDFTVGAV